MRGMEIGLSRHEECPIHSNLSSMCYNRADPFCNSIRCKAANRTPALRVWHKARPKESICYILKLPLGAFRSTGPKAGPMESICYTGLETAAGLKPAPRSLHVLKLLLGTFRSTGPMAGPKESICSWNRHWAQGRAQGVYLAQVLKLLLGSFRSTGPKAGHKESLCYGSETAAGHSSSTGMGRRPGSRSLSATRLETAVGNFSFHWAQGRAQGIYLLRVLKMLLGTCCSTRHKAGPKESSVTGLETSVSYHWAQGRAQGIYLLRVWNCRWGTFRSNGPNVEGAQGDYLLRVLKLLLSTFRSTGPKAGPKDLICYTTLETAAGHFSFHWAQGGSKESITSWSCHWAQGQAQGVYLLRVLKLLLGTFRSTGHKAGLKESICYRSWNWALFVPLGPRPGQRNLSVTGLETAAGPKARPKESICYECI